jgi:hypothetical protein
MANRPGSCAPESSPEEGGYRTAGKWSGHGVLPRPVAASDRDRPHVRIETQGPVPSTNEHGGARDRFTPPDAMERFQPAIGSTDLVHHARGGQVAGARAFAGPAIGTILPRLPAGGPANEVYRR